MEEIEKVIAEFSLEKHQAQEVFIGQFVQHFNKQANPNHKNSFIEGKVFKLHLWSQQTTYTTTWWIRVITYYKLLLFVISM